MAMMSTTTRKPMTLPAIIAALTVVVVALPGTTCMLVVRTMGVLDTMTPHVRSDEDVGASISI